jgi:hypothetical protein
MTADLQISERRFYLGWPHAVTAMLLFAPAAVMAAAWMLQPRFEAALNQGLADALGVTGLWCSTAFPNQLTWLLTKIGVEPHLALAGTVAVSAGFSVWFARLLILSDWRARSALLLGYVLLCVGCSVAGAGLLK